MINQEYKLKNYLKDHPWACIAYKIDKPHKNITYDRPFTVYYNDISWRNSQKSSFVIFEGDCYLGNPVEFPCSIDEEDQILIAKDMIDELLNNSNLKELDLEDEGKVPCGKYYDKCENCPEYKYGMGKNLEDSCFGVMYEIPSHINFWTNTLNKWNPIYGDKSENHKIYIQNQFIGQINQYMHICGNSEKLLKESLEYMKNHTSNKYKDLFK